MARPLRADAQRNRARILEAAEVVFAAEGIEVPVDTIAEKAGVGVGTLYRHFPTKEKLCEAILLERLSALTVDARALADAADPAAAFFGFLDHIVEEGAAKRDLLVAVMGAGLAFDLAAAEVKDELREAVGVLLQRAQAVGAVRPDVTAAMVVALVGATCQAGRARRRGAGRRHAHHRLRRAAAAGRRLNGAPRPLSGAVAPQHPAEGVDRAVQRKPPVGLDHLAGDPLHGVQRDDGLRDVVRLAQPAQRGALGHAGQPR